MNIPMSRGERTARIGFELTLPSLNEISKVKRRRLNQFETKQDMNFTCMVKNDA